jgi:hypothetical protein
MLGTPTFQKQQYTAFRPNQGAADLSWIALVFAICSGTTNPVDSDETSSFDIWFNAPGFRDLSSVAYGLRTFIIICHLKDEIFMRHDLSIRETLLLLTHTISNHERVECVWKLLGIPLDSGRDSSMLLLIWLNEYWDCIEM